MTCTRKRCKRRASSAGLCGTHATATADELFSKIIRARGACENCGTADNLQCAHGLSRRYRNVRFDARNAFALCRACHVYFTHRPVEWDLWLLDRLGVETCRAVRELAIDPGAKPDMELVLAVLRAQWHELEDA